MTIVELRFTFAGDPAGRANTAASHSEVTGWPRTNRLQRGFADAIRESTSTFLRDPGHEFAPQGSYSMRTRVTMAVSPVGPGTADWATAFVVDLRARSAYATTLYEHVLVDALAELDVAYAAFQLRRSDPSDDRTPDLMRGPATAWRYHEFFAWCADVVLWASGSDRVLWVECKTNRREYRAAYDLQPLAALLARFGDGNVAARGGMRAGPGGSRLASGNAVVTPVSADPDHAAEPGVRADGPAARGKIEVGAERAAVTDDWAAPLAAAAEAGDAESFVRAAGATDWSERTADEFRRAVRWALVAGAHPVARALAHDGAARHPHHGELDRLAAVLAPPRIVATPPTVDAALRANHAWLRAHGSEYRGRWVALRAGTVIADDSTRAAVRARVGAEPGIVVTKVA